MIIGAYGANDGVPLEAIMDAWKIDGAGVIIDGNFVKNPKYKG